MFLQLSQQNLQPVTVALRLLYYCVGIETSGRAHRALAIQCIYLELSN
jgi:hypothetical protein